MIKDKAVIIIGASRSPGRSASARFSMEQQSDIFGRLRSGEPVPMNDPGFRQIAEAVNHTLRLLRQLNSAEDTDRVRRLLSELIGHQVDESTTLFPPLHTNYGRNITLGKNVFINHACSFLDLGGITIEDGVMIGPRVNITSENHPVDLQRRKTLVPGEVVIRKNAWIGAGATFCRESQSARARSWLLERSLRKTCQAAPSWAACPPNF